jgi:hypothetical protein
MTQSGLPGIRNLILAHNHNDSDTKSRNRIIAGRTKRWATTIAQSWNCIAWSAQSWSLKTEVSGLARRSGGTNSGELKIVGVTKRLYSSRCTLARRAHGSSKASPHLKEAGPSAVWRAWASPILKQQIRHKTEGRGVGYFDPWPAETASTMSALRAGANIYHWWHEVCL